MAAIQDQFVRFLLLLALNISPLGLCQYIVSTVGTTSSALAARILKKRRAVNLELN